MWELREGPLTFRELQQSCGGVSPSVLNGRLAQLNEAQLVFRGDVGYRLTQLGEELMTELDPLRVWSQKWAGRLDEIAAE